MKRIWVGIWLFVVLLPFSSLTAIAQSSTGGESSPLIVGAWKLVCDNSACQSPIVDTEFRFINPTTLTVTLEYAFFENGGANNSGAFCGCDRDTLGPNKTTVYTASGERNSSPSLMTCTGNSGALKSIVFISHGGNSPISISGVTQTGFQTHLFGSINSGPDGSTSFANTMAEAGMKAIVITPQTVAEINAIHQACVGFLGPLK